MSQSSLNRLGTKVWSKVNEYAVKNRVLINVATEISKGVAQFFIWGKSASLVEGAFSAAKSIGHLTYYPETYFSVNNGWEPLLYNSTNIAHLFINTLQQFPCTPLKFGDYDNANVKLVDTVLGQLGVITYRGSDYERSHIYYRPETTNLAKLQDFLVEQFLKGLDTQFFSANEVNTSRYGDTSITLVPEKIDSVIHSKRTDEWLDYLKVCLEKDIHRSILFYGLPGVGKTELCRSLIKSLSLRTLRFRFSEHYDFNHFRFIIEAFKIEVVVMDDLDASDNTIELLEFLEYLHKQSKIVLITANRTNELAPALTRPARIDLIVKVDALETNAIKNLLGTALYKTYGARVKNWPVAYLQELIQRKAIGKEEMDVVFEELKKRVEEQRKKFKMEKK